MDHGPMKTTETYYWSWKFYPMPNIMGIWLGYCKDVAQSVMKIHFSNSRWQRLVNQVYVLDKICLTYRHLFIHNKT